MRTLAPDAWQEAAERLHATVLHHGLSADPSRTRDIASVLRPAGTFNYKILPGRAVIAGELRPAYSIEYLSGFLQPAERTDTARRIRPIDGGIDAEFLGYPENPVSAAAVSQSCKWLNQVAIQKRGNVQEPLWYASLGILAFADDGDEIAHAWSDGHPGYSVDATDAKLEQARQKQMGPTTCAHF